MKNKKAKKCRHDWVFIECNTCGHWEQECIKCGKSKCSEITKKERTVKKKEL